MIIQWKIPPPPLLDVAISEEPGYSLWLWGHLLDSQFPRKQFSLEIVLPLPTSGWRSGWRGFETTMGTYLGCNWTRHSRLFLLPVVEVWIHSCSLMLRSDYIWFNRVSQCWHQIWLTSQTNFWNLAAAQDCSEYKISGKWSNFKSHMYSYVFPYW